MSELTGALSYRKSTNDFYVNETGTNDGWVPLPLSINPEDITAKDVDKLLEKLGGSNQSQYFVDGSNPNASDSKDNKGNSVLKPFKTLERALIEVARRSFKKGAENDRYERMSIIVAPGEYEVNNAPSSSILLNDFPNYDRYQDASNLILKNSDWIVNEAWNTIPLEYRSESRRRDLRYFLNALVNDLSQGSNIKSVEIARSLVSSDKNLTPNIDPVNPGVPGIPDAGYFIAEYDNGPSNTNERSQTKTALQTLRDRAISAMRNEAPYKDLSVIVDSDPGVEGLCTDVYNTIHTLIKISTDTLDCLVDPREIYINYESSSGSFPEEGEPLSAVFQSFNSPDRAGIILPRGVSIIGEDLRKVIFRPKYVPDRDGSEGRGAIFRMTGGNFFSGFTVKDNKEVAAEGKSHHNLSVFEFCSSSALEDYYEKIRTAFEDKSIFNRALDAANLLDRNIDWISKKSTPSVVAPGNLNYAKIFEAEIYNFISALIKDLRSLDKNAIMEFGQRFHISHILTLDAGLQENAKTFYNDLFDDSLTFIQLAINNEANVAEGGYQDYNIIIDDEGTTAEYPIGDNTFITGRCADILAAIYTYRDISKNLISGIPIPTYEIANTFTASDTEVVQEETTIVAPTSTPNLANSVVGSSPYIFSASLRSEYGMCGIDGDGSQVKGFKSYLAAQFTIISLQKDTSVFVNDDIEIGNRRYLGNKLSDPQDFSNFGYRVSNGAYSQLVSCFCIGPAKHYLAESGGEFSITNSTSNFGDISLYSRGFNTVNSDGIDDGIGAYSQDKDHTLVGLIKPKTFKFEENNYQYFLVGSVVNYDISTNTQPPNLTNDLSWSSASNGWKNWTVDYGSIETTGTPPDENVYYLDRPLYSEFTAINYVRLKFQGSLADSPAIEKDEQGKPILKYVYCFASSAEAVSKPDDLPPLDNSSQVVVPFDSNYNSNLEVERRAKVIEIAEDEEGFTYVLLDVTDWENPLTNSTGTRGEWFERDTYYNAPDGNRVFINTRLLGVNIYIKRFIDNRDQEDKKYKFIFKKDSSTKRLTPNNFILRKQTGVLSELDQPFKFIDTDTLDTIFHSNNVQILKDEDILELTDNSSTISALEIMNQEAGSGPLLFSCELLSSNADNDGRPNTEDDILETSKFIWYDDSEDIISLSDEDKKSLLSNSTSENYLSKTSAEKVLTLAGLDSSYDFDAVLDDDRISYLSTSKFAFSKPSTIRCGGQTWEFMGYYNYSTSLPFLQTQNLGDKLKGNQKKLHRLEKIQRNVLGGRVYASGMDELGNIIQGNTIIDLKTGDTETVITGVSPEVNTAESISQTTSPQDIRLNTLARHDRVTAVNTDQIEITLVGQQLAVNIKDNSVLKTQLSNDVKASLNLADSALQSNDNISELVNDAGYLQSNDNISELVNDAGYLQSNDNISELVNDAGYLQSNDNISELVNDANYITLAEIPQEEVKLIIPLGPIDKDADLITDVPLLGRYFTFNGTIESLRLEIDTAPTGSAFEADIKKNGVSIFNTLPNIADGATTSGEILGAVLASDTIDEGDLITFSVTQIGSTNSGVYPVFIINMVEV